MSLEEFKKLKVTFSAQGWPKLNDKIKREFTNESFEMTDVLPLFQMAAHEQLQKLKGAQNVAMSVKYQVLSKETAMIGVVKQKKKATGEMLEYHIQMGKA